MRCESVIRRKLQKLIENTHKTETMCYKTGTEHKSLFRFYLHEGYLNLSCGGSLPSCAVDPSQPTLFFLLSVGPVTL